MKSKKYKICLLAFIIPVLIILISISVLDILNIKAFRLGENYLLVDMSSQYLSLYHYIRDVFLFKASPFYTFSKGLGGNMASTIGYYLGSPLNILYIFSNKTLMPLFTFLLFVFKTGLCSLFMNAFLDYKFKSRYTNIIFAISYALMGFMTVYYFNNMWFDCLYMTPLIMLGVNKLIEGKSKLYIISLSLTIIFNFYIAYMICIFSLLYFLYELFCKYKFKDIKIYYKIVIRFILYSLLSVGISFIFLLPIVLNLRHVMRFELDPALLQFNVIQIIKKVPDTIISKMYLGSHNTTSILGRNRPVLYVSLFSLILCILYFFNNNFKIKERILSLIMILILIISMLIPQLQLFWQGFSFPNGYIDRFSFLYGFFIIYLAARCFYHPGVKIRYSVIIYIILSIVSYKVSKIYLVYLSKSDIIISQVFVLIYVILYHLYNKVDKKIILKYILLILVIVEVTINYVDTIVTMDDLKIHENYSLYINEACHNMNHLEDNFYRLDTNYYWSNLDSFVCGTNGYAEALSTNNGDMYRFMYNHGFSLTYTTVSFDNDKLPIFDMLFGIKYINTKDKLTNDFYKEKNSYQVTKYNSFLKVNELRDIYVYQNPYALELGYLINYHHIKRNKNNNSFDNINDLIKEVTGINDNILKPIRMKKTGNGEYEVDIDTDSKYLYLTADYSIPVNWENYESIRINDEYVASLDSSNIGTVKIENKYQNSKIKLSLDNNQFKNNRNIYMYDFDIDVFKRVYKILSKNQLKDIKVNKNKVEGRISTKTDKTLMMAIPYEKGWKIYLDGKRVKYKKIANNFIGIDIPKGNHRIKLVYYSEGFFIGLLVSSISIGIFAYLCIKKQN